MKQFLVLGALLTVSSGAFAAPCVSGSLQDYINLGAGGCQLGTLFISGVLPEPGQNTATTINAAQVQVATGGSPLMPTLLFTLNKTATSNQIFESFFRFNVSGPLLAASSIALNSPVATGDGVVTATEDVCPGGSFSGNAPSGCAKAASLVAFATASGSQLSDSASFASTNMLDVFVDLTADGGPSGTAVFNSATVSFTATPEPSAALLMLTGFATLVAFRYRRNS